LRKALSDKATSEWKSGGREEQTMEITGGKLCRLKEQQAKDHSLANALSVRRNNKDANMVGYGSQRKW
jgi:hypothetical protein